MSVSDFKPPAKKADLKNEVIIITEETKEDYAIARTPGNHEEFVKKYADRENGDLLDHLFMRTQTCKIFIQRYENACKVIDLIAEELGMTDSGHGLYFPSPDGSPLVNKIRDYIARGGRKAEMKKQIDELQTENAVLRSLLGK